MDGTGFVICVCGTLRQIVIPLSENLSGEIMQLVNEEGLKVDRLIRPALVVNG